MKAVKPVYVWQVPVRIYHWVNMLCIITLFATGLYIGSPDLRPDPGAGEAATLFRMGDMLYWHMLAAYIFTANFLFRVYWAYVGNRYARSFVCPWVKTGAGFKDTLLGYLFLKKGEAPSLGHNTLASLAYFIFLFLGSLFMIFTGFAMYSEARPEGTLAAMFGWVLGALGGSYPTHMDHHIFAWVIMVFVVIHLYLVIRHDIFSRSGVISSMFTGYKYENRP